MDHLPVIQPPSAPMGAKVWSKALLVVSVLVILFTLDKVSLLLANFWLLESLDLQSVFWTNFSMGATLYVVGLIVFFAAGLLPLLSHPLRWPTRQALIPAVFLIATVGAYSLSLEYKDFLFGIQTITFAEKDPVFQKDIGFYVFDLPYFWTIWDYALYAGIWLLLVSLFSAYLSRPQNEATQTLNPLNRFLGAFGTPVTRVAVLIIGVLAAVGMWLQRYDLLIKDNSASSVHVGAEYVDVTGFFSTLNYINLTVLIILAAAVVVAWWLGQLHQALHHNQAVDAKLWRRFLGLIALVVGANLAFKLLVEARDLVAVKPNEPVIQLDYIDQHIAATQKAYDLTDIKAIEFKPNQPGDPVPTLAELMNHPTIKNAPLWPGFSSYLERLLDPQHAERILATNGDAMVYGPTLDIFQQKQKLRTYYRFLGVDTTRYTIDGEQQMFVSAVRELPLFEPVPWLNYWGQRYMLYTHGFGMVLAPTAKISAEGTPEFVSKNIPSETELGAFKISNERIYYGEGSETMAFSNVDRVSELDYPTDQDRAEIQLPAEVDSGIHLDSLLKRVVFGWQSGRFMEFVFSDLIKPNTRVHYYRTPLDRLAQAAPFLHFDTNPYAVIADGEVNWLVNAMSTSDRYPYSRFGELGDKSDERALFPRQNRLVNYVEDSVKATVNAVDGQIKFYQISDDPVIATWASVYPDLFTQAEQMPVSVQQQITYPSHFFHLQFDDLYIYYHMRDPMYFFNLEDMWDDGDEVLGPVLDSGKAITFSIEPYPLIVPTEAGTQYTQFLIFTPEKALNLRAVPMVYQDGDAYGQKQVLLVPKGQYVMGPEQADAMIDQDPDISRNFALWNRMGMEVIRGHTTGLFIENEVIYVEPIFLRSQQNPMAQLKQIAVVFRNKVAIGDTLEQALANVLAKHQPSVLPSPAFVPELQDATYETN